MSSVLQQHKQLAMKHRKLVALNNAGVHLMQRRLFNEAVQTFQEAIKLTMNKYTSNDMNTSQHQDAVEQALQRSWKRTALGPTTTTNFRGLQTITVSSQEEPSTIQILDEQLFKTDFFIHIDPICTEETLGKDNYPLDCGILLYNHGIANKILAERSKNYETYTDCRDACIHSMSMAEDFLSNYYRHSFLCTEYNNLLLELLLNRSILFMTVNEREMKWYTQKLREILAIIHARRDLLVLMPPKSAACA